MVESFVQAGVALGIVEDLRDRPALRKYIRAALLTLTAGSALAFGLLFDHYHPSVYRFLYYRTRSQTLAEDLTSETFFRALNRIGYDGPIVFESFSRIAGCTRTTSTSS